MDRNSQIVAIEVVRSQYNELVSKGYDNPVKELQTILNPQATIKKKPTDEKPPNAKKPNKKPRTVERTTTKIAGVDTYIYTPKGFEESEKQNKAVCSI